MGWGPSFPGCPGARAGDFPAGSNPSHLGWDQRAAQSRRDRGWAYPRVCTCSLRQPTAQTTNPKPHIPNLTGQIPNPASQILHPKPHILHSTSLIHGARDPSFIPHPKPTDSVDLSHTAHPTPKDPSIHPSLLIPHPWIHPSSRIPHPRIHGSIPNPSSHIPHSSCVFIPHPRIHGSIPHPTSTDPWIHPPSPHPSPRKDFPPAFQRFRKT